MISEQDKSTVVATAARYGAKRVVLFGSSADPGREARDIDIGVEGIAPERFFAFYGELMSRVSKPVDVVDLGEDSRFTRLIRRDGVTLYVGSERTDRS